jgi:chromosome segregation ATPase
MAERPDDRRQARPIVPDPDDSLTPHRFRYPRPPRVWPLWLLILLLIAGLAGMAWMAWEERERFQRDLTRLSGEISNVHARFDMEEGRGEALEGVQSRLDALEQQDEQMQEQVSSRLAAVDERFDELQARVVRIGEAAATREAMLAAIQASLDALERRGEEGRAALDERLIAMSEMQARDGERLEGVIDRVAERENDIPASALEERLTSIEVQLQDRIDEAQARLSGLGTEVEALASSQDDGGERIAAMDGRVAALASDIGELRRAQLALSAQLEALRP